MYIKDHTFIFLATSKYDGPYESTSFTIAKVLAENNDVYFVENPYTWKDYLKREPLDAWKRRSKKFSYFSDGIIDTENPRLKIVVCPPLLSIHFLKEGKIYRNLLKLNEWIIARRINKVLKKKNTTRFIFFNSFNFHYPDTADYLSPAPLVSVYQSVDPLASDYDRKHGVLSEEKVVRRSDLVICTSLDITKQKLKINSNTHFVPNGVDKRVLNAFAEPSLSVHPSIAPYRNKPVIGYFGNIERRIDYDLLRSVTERHKDKNFVLAGPIGEEYVPQWVYSAENIILPGHFAYADMPAVVKGFDIAMIPFKNDENSRSIFPLKLFEYLAAGKPTIVTDFNPDLGAVTGNLVSYVSNATQFSDQIGLLLGSDSVEAQQERYKLAGANTWNQRILKIISLLKGVLQKS